MKVLLYIAHFFPPLGGAGVQRSAKFCKYLPKHGFTPVVLTGSGRVGGKWAPRDSSLLGDVSDCSKVFRPNYENGNRIHRFNSLVDAGRQAIREHRPNLILVSVSPFEDTRIAATLSHEFSIPWVADLRDPWALDEFRVYRTWIHRKMEERRMKQALLSASLIIMNTPEASIHLQARFPEFRGRTTVITNGYDVEDFADLPPTARNDRFTVVHSGYLHTEAGLRQEKQAIQYRVLGRTAPGVEFLSRSHFYLLRALEQWQISNCDVRKRVRLVLVGAMTDTDRKVLLTSAAAPLVEVADYLPHAESLLRVRNADLLFLPLHKLAPGQRATIVPGKTYEYMASERPILAALPPGDARDFVNQAGTGLVCEPKDVSAMLGVLQAAYSAWIEGRPITKANRASIEIFERGVLTSNLACALDRVVSVNASLGSMERG